MSAPAIEPQLVALDEVLTDLPPMGRAAAKLADAGRWVFPIAPHGKLPAIETAHPEDDPLRGHCRGECGKLGHGLYDATRDLVVIASYWMRWPEANIGISCGPSNLLVVDLDGPAGRRAWAELEAEHGAVDTLRSSTGRADGGVHLLYRQPAGVRLGNGRGALPPKVDGQGIDVRGQGGYIVAPPSVHPSGERYDWFHVPAAAQLPVVPDWLLAILTARKEPERAPRPARAVLPDGASRAAKILAGLVTTVLNAAEGTRNDTLNWAAYRLGEHIAAGRVDANEGVRALTLAAEGAGLTDREIGKTIASGLRGVA